MERKKEVGTFEVICGCMFSGKTEELIRVLKRSFIAKQKILVFKHSSDIRYSQEELCSHNGLKISSILISNSKDIFLHDLADVNVIGIDEIQFFSDSICDDIEELLERGIRVVVAGLDLDYKKRPFGCMSKLLAMANKVTKLTAICTKCGHDAYYSQRVVHDNEVVFVGASESYEPRCRLHHIIH